MNIVHIDAGMVLPQVAKEAATIHKAHIADLARDGRLGHLATST